MRPTLHFRSWRSLLVISIVNLAVFGCTEAPEPAGPEVSTVSTGVTGLAEIPGTSMQLTVRDLVSGEPLPGMRVNVIVTPDRDDALIFVEDPEAFYAPTATSWSELEAVAGASRAQLTTVIPTILMASDDEYWTTYLVPPDLSEWWEDTAYDCKINTLDRLQAEVAPDLIDLFGGFVRDEYIGLAIAGFPAGLFVLKVYGAYVMTEFIVDSWINFALATFRWQGYEGGESFRICYKKAWQLMAPTPGPIAYWMPLQPPSTIEQYLSGLFGVVRDETTGSPITGASVQIAGPEFRHVRTDTAGEYAFEYLPTGDYEVAVSSAGYYRGVASVSLGQESRFRDFTLIPFDGSVPPGVNVALAARGATTGDNGHFDDGVHTPGPSAWAIDGDLTTYWAGLAHASPQMMWVDFDATYSINRIVVHELSVAYINTGLLEYFDGSTWRTVAAIEKSAAGFEVEFAAVNAAAVRLTVYSNTAPSGWYNRVACITELEVYAAP